MVSKRTKASENTAANIEKLRSLFPQVVLEGKIDPEALEATFGTRPADLGEAFGLQWHGKRAALLRAQENSKSALVPCEEQSEDYSTTNNLFIEGDNLEALKILKNQYQEKIKLIYIDPPYNTGNNFLYPDDYKSSVGQYKKQTSQKGAQTGNGKTAGRFHTHWLSMMAPRLLLAHEMLRPDGVIFISIDENEIHHLRTLCDEIFGTEHFLAELVIKVRHEKRILKGHKDFHEVYEYCLVYRKSAAYKQVKRIESNTSTDKYCYEVVLKGQPVERQVLEGKEVEVYGPQNYEVIKHTRSNAKLLQRISIRGSLKEGNSSGRFFMKNLHGADEKRGYLYKVPDIGADGLGYRFFMCPPTEKHVNGVYFQGMPLNRKDTKEVPYPNFYDFVKDFNNVGYEGQVEFRNGKKPLALLQQLFVLGGLKNDKECLVMDFFAGSGSTGEALMRFNQKDGGQRSFVLVQLPHPTYEVDKKGQRKESPSSLAGFETIADITKTRLRRAKQNILTDHPKATTDLGFKVFFIENKE